MARRTWEQYEKYLLQRWPLTLREVRIAIECLRGKKNREIASVLQISSETVNKHLDHIYRVIGINGRDQLAAELLIADIDNTPLQQSITLVGEGASIVGAGFLDTLYASRGERKRPRSLNVSSPASKKAPGRSGFESPTAEEQPLNIEQVAAVSVDSSPESGSWLIAERTPATNVEDGMAFSGDLSMTINAGES